MSEEAHFQKWVSVGDLTDYQLPVYDAAGTLLGYIPVYSPAWS